MNTTTAVYIGADPLTINDTILLTKAISTFGFIKILLDRKNRDAAYYHYCLSYTDRADIIEHDLAEKKITAFEIIPIDTTVQSICHEQSIKTLILNLDYQRLTNFEMLKIMQVVCPDVNIMCLSAPNFIEKRFIKTLVNSDSSMTLYKNFCSDYAYCKFKMKTMKKIGITGNVGGFVSQCASVFREQGFPVIDLDEHIRLLQVDPKVKREIKKLFSTAGVKLADVSKMEIIHACTTNEICKTTFERLLFKSIQCEIATKIIETFADTVVVKFDLLYEFAMEKLFDTVVCVETPVEVQYAELISRGCSPDYIKYLEDLEIDMSEKARFADWVIHYSDPRTLKNDTLEMIKSKFR